jgi:beta-phosphoglucomutase-like phosphatase (HAD superfamily)
MSAGAFDVVLFELEGVLAETAALREEALRNALEAEGVRFGVEAARSLAAIEPDLPLRAAAAAALTASGNPFDETTLDLVVMRAEDGFRAAAGKGLTLAPGARELVAALGGSVRLAIVTRAPRRDAELVLSLADLEPCFEVIVAGDDPAPVGAAPQAYERALAHLARRREPRRERVLALVDGLTGVRAARAAGIRCAVIGEVPMYRAVEADAHFESLEGLSMDAIEELVLGREEWIP